jgi:peptidoglycan L-alanyl-D-glutamate endopeptidase CwlK
MSAFGQSSLEKRATLHPDLQSVLDEAILYNDFTITDGGRTAQEQFQLYKIGRKLDDKGKWIKVGKVVTNCDGYKSISNHQSVPSKAVDIAPWPIDYGDELSFALLIGRILEIARRQKAEGKIKSTIRSGADWDNDGKTKDERLIDLPHLQIIDE